MAEKTADFIDDGDLCISEPAEDVPVSDSAIRGSAPELLYDDKKKWQKDGPGNIILRVCFMQEPPPTTSPEAISEEMGEWSNYCGVKFKKADYPDKSDIRISFEKGYSNSAVGTDANLPQYKGKATMNLGKVDRRTILHETGHALGLVHEHQHPEGKIKWDTDKLIEDLCDNGPKWDEERIKRNIITPHKRSEVKGTKRMDPDSIMAYRLKERWVKNAGDPALKLLFKKNTKLSDLDKKTIGKMYPKPTIHLSSDEDDTESAGQNYPVKSRIEADVVDHYEPAQPTNQLKSSGPTGEEAYYPPSTTSPDIPSHMGARIASNQKPSEFVFTSKHLSELFRVLIQYANKWKAIGGLLGVPRLNVIKVDNDDADDSLREMLSIWLKQIDPLPTKEKLVSAVESATQDPELAKKISDMFH